MAVLPWPLPLPSSLSGWSRSRWFWPGLLFSYCLLVFWLSSRPMLPAPELFRWQDKLYHAIGYAVMAGLAWASFRPYLSLRALLWCVPLFCLIYGISDEFHQSFVPERRADIADVAADLFGALLLTVVRWRGEFKGSSR